MKHEMPQLPYEQNALQPYMSAETLEYHYGKHLQAYVNNLNDLIQGTKYENASLETIIKEAEGPVFNNGAQVWNHTLFFPFVVSLPQETAGRRISRSYRAGFWLFRSV